MKLALVADTFVPLRTSGAVQLRDLSREFVRQGHDLTVLLPGSDQNQPWVLEDMDGVRVLRLKAPRTKDIGRIRRALAELAMPFAMRRAMRASPLAQARWDGVVWYSPSIFHGPLVKVLKRASGCKGYLIIRDIFPEWAADMGLMGRGLPYCFFQAIARYQYSVADFIGVQSPGNLEYFSSFLARHPERRVEVLQNWLGKETESPCPIDITRTALAGRRIFVYAGNMGVAQQMDKLLDLATAMRDHENIGFLFVGRGSEASRLRRRANELRLYNTLFHDEISPDEIPALYRQCDVGLISLDSRHKTHNIPGKFLTYMQAGLPVLASVNDGNDLKALIEAKGVGRVSVEPTTRDLPELAAGMLEREVRDETIRARCRSLSEEMFSARAAVQQILRALEAR